MVYFRAQTQLTSNSRPLHFIISVPKLSEEMATTGDYQLASQLAAAFEQLAHTAKVIGVDHPRTQKGDDVIYLCLAGHHQPLPTPGAVNLIWAISNAPSLPLELCRSFQGVFSASQSHARWLSEQLDRQVPFIPQFTGNRAQINRLTTGWRAGGP